MDLEDPGEFITFGSDEDYDILENLDIWLGDGVLATLYNQDPFREFQIAIRVQSPDEQRNIVFTTRSDRPELAGDTAEETQHNLLEFFRLCLEGATNKMPTHFRVHVTVEILDEQ